MPVPPDFIPWIREQVAAWADRYGVADHRAFPAWGLHFVFDLEEDDSFNQTDTLSQGDAGLDGWFFDRSAGVFHLVQAKWLEDPLDSTADIGELRSLLHAAVLLKDPSAIEEGPHRDRLTNVALELQQAVLDNATVSLDFFIAGRVTAHTEQELADAARALGEEYSVALYDTDRLYEIRLADDPIEDLSGQDVRLLLSGANDYFDRVQLGIPGVESAAVAAIDGRSLADAVDRWGARLFHANVRYYLRRSNKINKNMLATLDTEDGRKAFWLYNNGITIVADSFSFEERNGAVDLVAQNPQVVNGAQTSSVMKERRAHLQPGDVSVQARVISVETDAEGQAALERISEFTNSQSPVRASDLRSNDRRHRQLQAAFDMLSSPVFYERRRGEWYSLSAAQRARYTLQVTKESVGQRYLAFAGEPAVAIASKADLFGALEAVAYDPNVSAQVYMLAYELYARADTLMQQSNADQLLALVPSLGGRIVPGDDSAPTQLETLRRPRKLVCMHALALARHMLVWRYHEIGEQRARVLRERLADQNNNTATFVWRYVFRAIRQWLMLQPDKSAIKAQLQRTETLGEMSGIADDLLVEAQRDELSPLA